MCHVLLGSIYIMNYGQTEPDIIHVPYFSWVSSHFIKKPWNRKVADGFVGGCVAAPFNQKGATQILKTARYECLNGSIFTC